MTAPATDRMRLEVFHHLFAAVAEEMGAALMRSAFSPNIKERRDFSCALFDADGRMISQAAHIPIHLGSAPLCVRAVQAALELGPGDCAILNDPFEGGTHLPDITLVAPVFLPGDARPSFWVANRAHHADVGGASPGSMAPARDVHGEGLRIPPTRLVRAGQVERELLRLCVANMRVPAEREGDLLAQWSANRLGVRRIEELAREHGARQLVRRGAELCAWTADLTANVIRALPDRRGSFEDVLEGGRPDGRPVKLTVSLAVQGASMRVDFSGCDDQVAGPVNTTRAVAVSAVFYVLRSLLPSNAPNNDGCLEQIEIVTRPGSLVDALYPAPVCAGNVETSQRLVDVLLGAWARLDRGRVPAASAGTMSNLTFGGRRHDGGAYTYYETLAGGAGASAGADGAHALHTHMTNTRNTPVEALETGFPVRVVGTSVRRSSGGDGTHAGGDGILRRLRFLQPAHVAWVAERQQAGPWGLAGGAPGAPGAARLHRVASKRGERLRAPATIDVEAGDEIEISTPGGGGVGRARKRL